MRIRPSIAACALLTVALIGASPAQAAGDRDGGRITYGRYDPAIDTFSLWAADLDGTDQELLVPGPAFFSDWSPDGSTIAFDFEDATGVHVATVPAGGGPVTVLTSAPGVQESPKWSPDGKWITYGAFDPAQDFFSTSIWVMRSDGTDARRVTDDGFDVEPVFSPDGRRIAFGRITGDSPDGQLEALYTVRVNGRQLREVIPPRAGLEHPDWSPDGRRLTVNIAPESPTAADAGSVLSVRPDGRSVRVLRHATDDFAFYKAVWSPDGRRLLTGCFDRQALIERLCTMTAAGNRVEVVPDIVGVNFPAWGVQDTHRR